MLTALTSFRFLAALMVFIYHVGIWSSYQLGYLGVSFFFILSGFILAYSYCTKLRDVNRAQIISFYIGRVAKIYPLHVLTFFFAIPYYFFIPLKHEPILYVFQAVTNIALVHSFIPFGNVSFNGVSWSLCNELFFYAVFPFIIFAILKYIKRMAMRLLVVGILWLVAIIIFALLPDNNSLVFWFTYFSPFSRVIEFFIGVILGLTFLEKRHVLTKYSPTVYSALEICSILLLVSIIVYAPNLPQNIRYGLIFVPIWSLVIFVFSFQRGVLSSLLSNNILVLLGKVSFSFYMIHNLILSYILFLWKPPIHEYVTIVGCFIITIVSSYVLYRFYEEPMRIRCKAYLHEKVNNRQKSVVTGISREEVAN